MKRLTLILSAVLLLALAGVASGKIVQLGDGEPFLPSSKCPNDPCLAAYQVTGYQHSADNKKNRFLIRRSGKVVAFTVKLGKLSANQVQTFDQQFGAPASVRLTILRRGKKRSRRNDHRVLAQSDTFEVNDFFGESPTFVLDKPLNAPLGSLVALTVPTWAPVLAGDQGRQTVWRSSRVKDRCGEGRRLAPRSTQQRVGQLVTWGCNYSGARLLYTATYVPANRTSKPPE